MSEKEDPADHAPEPKNPAEAKFNRRDFLKLATLGLGSLALGNTVRRCSRNTVSAIISDEFTPTAYSYLPYVTRNEPTATPTATNTPTPTPTPTHTPTPTEAPSQHRVTHVHSSAATNWDFGSDYYGNYVDQDSVNTMVDAGVMSVTNTSTIDDAWRALIPDYAPGDGIAIKVSLNNTWSCTHSANAIDALIHPVNAIVRGLKQMGVLEEDIWIYDAIRYIPDRFVGGCIYPNVQFFGNCRQSPGWSSNDPNAYVTFNRPQDPNPSPVRLTDLLVNTKYLINMPIIKTHSAGVSISFKNHFGSIKDPGSLHDYILPDGSLFRTDYSPYVDMHQNPHIGAKTILTVGEGLFGAWTGYTSTPSPWATFGDAAANSLFFSTDPVALDCVMYDLLAAELSVHDDQIKENSDAYLSVAADAGLGIFEHGDPWGSGYNLIDYVKIDI